MTSSGCSGHRRPARRTSSGTATPEDLWRSQFFLPQRWAAEYWGPTQALALLHRAHRGGGNEPLTHIITGPLASALGFDLPWVITSLVPTEGMNLEIVVRLIELDPEAVSAGSAEVMPGSDEPETDPLPDADEALTDEQRDRLAEYGGE